MKRIKQIAALSLCLVMVLSICGCVEKYYNGAVSIIEMNDDARYETEKYVEKVHQILAEGTLEELLALIPVNASEEDRAEYTRKLTEGWDQYQTMLSEHGSLQNIANRGEFFFCYKNAANLGYLLEDETVYESDMFFDGKNGLIYLDFYLSAESSEKQLKLPEELEERTVVIGEGTEYALEGTLTYPKEAVSLPAVLLISGVGSNSRDESAGNTKMFRDLAWGLAEEGFAVLRYDQRLFTYPDSVSLTSPETMGVDFQMIEDAVLAAKLLQEQPEADPEKLYLAGHDLGGQMTVRIDEQVRAAGYILMNTAARPWSEAAYDQAISYGLNGLESDNVSFMKTMLQSDIKALRSIDTLPEDQLSNVMLNQYAYFWKDLNSRDDAAAISETAKPVLILQGEADYQILTEKDFVLWQEKCAGKANFTLRSFPGLNHMMLEIEGPYGQVSQQYQRPLRVSEEVISEIASWIGD